MSGRQASGKTGTYHDKRCKNMIKEQTCPKRTLNCATSFKKNKGNCYYKFCYMNDPKKDMKIRTKNHMSSKKNHGNIKLCLVEIIGFSWDYSNLYSLIIS